MSYDHVEESVHCTGFPSNNGVQNPSFKMTPAKGLERKHCCAGTENIPGIPLQPGRLLSRIQPRGRCRVTILAALPMSVRSFADEPSGWGHFGTITSTNRAPKHEPPVALAMRKELPGAIAAKQKSTFDTAAPKSCQGAWSHIFMVTLTHRVLFSQSLRLRRGRKYSNASLLSPAYARLRATLGRARAHLWS